MTPFDIVYSQIITLMQDRELVLPGNLIVYNNVNRNPEKPGVATADLPELVLYLANIRGNFFASSSGPKFTATWRWVQCSGTYNSQVNNRLTWAMLQIMGDWKNNFADLEYEGRKFVKDVRLMLGNAGQDVNERTRNIRGWITLVDFEIDMFFLTDGFLAIE